MRILFIGDICGNPGRRIMKEVLPALRKEKMIDMVIANAENAAGGSGITYVIANEIYGMGVSALTMGNHTWSKKEIFSFIDSDTKMARPANFSEGTPGQGAVVVKAGNVSVGVLNLIGRVYMEPADCPFKAADRELAELKQKAKIILVDMHAEATSEKCAMAWHLDGRVSAVVGTHTHVQTADERIFPCGTAFITDVGMTGPYDSVIGVDKEIVLRKFVTQIPERFEVAKGPMQFAAVIIDIDEVTGKSRSIERVFIVKE